MSTPEHWMRKTGGLASLGACLGRAGRRYREKQDQEGAERIAGIEG